MKININKNEIKLTHALLSVVLDNEEAYHHVLEACALCFDLSQTETERTIKTLDHKVAQALKMSLINRAA